MLMIDDIDCQILHLLQEDSRLSNAALAEAVGLTASSVFERVKKLEKRGIIQKYVAVVDAAALGRPITAFIRLMVATTATDSYRTAKESLTAVCRSMAAVQECHTVSGTDCYILKIRVASMGELEKLIEKLRDTAFVTGSVSHIVLSSYKESTYVTPFVEAFPILER
jgi:Lrp/AsnC family transcriptional regulator, leucine-responsive regulatory protein